MKHGDFPVRKLLVYWRVLLSLNSPFDRCCADPELVALHPAGARAAPAADLQVHVGAEDAWWFSRFRWPSEPPMVDWKYPLVNIQKTMENHNF